MSKGKMDVNVQGEMKKVVRQLRKDGWTLEGKRKHVLATPPNGGSPVILPSTPAGPRWYQNTMAQIRRATR